MAEKRKYESRLDISNTSDLPSYFIERSDHILKLTKVVKSMEFTCSFCFKTFSSAQAMGGHQNAHRRERLDEKMIYMRDPIGYRKRAYLGTAKAKSSRVGGGVNSSARVHAASDMVKYELANVDVPPKITRKSECFPGDFGKFNAFGAHGNINLCPFSYITKDSHMCDIKGEGVEKLPLVMMNSLPTNEVSLAFSTVGAHEVDAEGKKCMEFSNGGKRVNLENLDLTLKL